MALLETPPLTKTLTASTEAVDFLSSVGLEELNLCLFSESLHTVSDSGNVLGSFTVTVQSAYYEQEGKEDEKCFLLHASSHSTVDDVPCETSISAYVSSKMETLEQHHQESLKMKSHSLDKKIHMKREGDKMVVHKVITEGQQVQHETTSHDLSSLNGLVSEASNLLLMRVLARRRNIANMDFLSFDADTKLCVSTYRPLGTRFQVIGKTEAEVHGIERTIHSEDIPTTWQCYFLPDGHLVSRVQIGSPLTAKLMAMPLLSEPGYVLYPYSGKDTLRQWNAYADDFFPNVFLEEEDPKPVFEKKVLNFEEDVQLYSEYLDRREELSSNHRTYISRHPELKALLADFMQAVLIKKPDDVIAFAADYFGPFSPAQERADTFPTFQGPQTMS